MEYFDIRNIDGSLTGKVKERKKVHEDGDIHGTSHVWIVRKNDQGKYELLLQKRSAMKDAYPGCYDISSAGHLPAGEDFLPSAIRELEEELGIRAKENELTFLGIHEGYSEDVFYGRPFRNHEISHVYIYDKNVDITELNLQKEEVESVKWMELDFCFEMSRNKNPNYCLFMDELEMIEKYLK
ncbi:MAG: NUDIX domain-containing protein [Clostridiales bacterium]|nr:NUDIX domain-containing protein [Clostridiales bacterium]